VDSCGLNDQQLGGIFQALVETHSESILSLSVTNQMIGSYCVEAFEELLPVVYSLTLHNLKFELP
jgi:hypothetical protein